MTTKDNVIQLAHALHEVWKSAPDGSDVFVLMAEAALASAQSPSLACHHCWNPATCIPCLESAQRQGIKIYAEQTMTDEQLISDRMAACYKDRPTEVAIACNKLIDRSGNLLGWVRKKARAAWAAPKVS